MTHRHPKPPILEQLSLDAHGVIEASAGTGKTYALEHLLVDLLLSTQTELESILVVTYTERAASELRTRLRAKLRAMLEPPAIEPPPEVPAWLIDQGAEKKLLGALGAFDVASISTIHAFCQRMLLEHAFLAERLFEQRLVDGRSAFSRGFMIALRSHIAKDEVEREYLDMWLRERTLEDLEALLYECHEKRGAIRPKFSPERALEIGLGLKSIMTSRPRMAAALSLSRVPQRTADAILDRLETLAGCLAELRSARDVPRFLALVALEEKRRSNGFLGYLADACAKNTVRDASAQKILGAVRELGRAMPTLAAAVVQRFLPIVERVIRGEKAREGELDFDDMLDLLWESLSGDRGEQVAEAMRARFRYALVDEFQDTDRTQWRIIERVFLEGGPGGPRLFVIGDPKQAIYGFRGADVDTYLAARRRIEGAGGRTVTLNANHRSSGALVEALNRVLDQGAANAFFTGDIRYDHPVAAAVASASPDAPLQIFSMLPQEGGPPELSIGALKRTLGRRIALEIRALLDGRLPMAVEAGDIFVLTRTGGESIEIARHLRARAIPYAFYKQEGLFQTDEAEHIRDLLRAVADPSRRSLRFKAWLTPFFAVPLERLASCAELPPNHPLIARLFDWKALADAREYHRLFSAILDESGIIRREILTQESERELTNYLHVFEILLEEAHRARAPLDELIHLLSAFIELRRLPEGADGNVQRLESERSAVQVMTMHKSKGLEAKVVFVFGGFDPFPGSVHVYHEDGERVLGVQARPRQAEKERDEEDQRLLYVAMTRAKERLYLPYFPLQPSQKRRTFIKGGVTAKHLSQVLDRIVTGGAAPKLFAVSSVQVAGEIAAEDPGPKIAAYASWTPPADLLEPVVSAVGPADLIALHRGFVISSYSRIKASQGGYHAPRLGEHQREELEPEVDAAGAEATGLELPGGPASGRFLHEVLEELPLASIAEMPFDLWCARRDTREIIDRSMKRHDRDPRFLGAVQRLAYDALSSPLPLGDRILSGGVASAAKTVREMEFLYPIPKGAGGFIKGYVDLVFEHEGKTYILDWKSDLLPSYSADELTHHVKNNYEVQGELYTIAILKMLGLDTHAEYDRRFGGMLFCFVRGMGAKGVRSERHAPGVQYFRPGWKDVHASTDRLIALGRASLSEEEGR